MDPSSGVAAALMSFTIPCVFCCISCNFAFGGTSVTLLMDHGTMSRLMFWTDKSKPNLPSKMRERMRQRCVLCVVTPDLPSPRESPQVDQWTANLPY